MQVRQRELSDVASDIAKKLDEYDRLAADCVAKKKEAEGLAGRVEGLAQEVRGGGRVREGGEGGQRRWGAVVLTAWPRKKRPTRWRGGWRGWCKRCV